MVVLSHRIYFDRFERGATKSNGQIPEDGGYQRAQNEQRITIWSHLNKRINSLSCNKEVFYNAAPLYNHALKHSNFDYNLHYTNHHSLTLTHQPDRIDNAT